MADIQINTSNLTYTQFTIPELSSPLIDGANTATLSLQPGSYRFQQISGVPASFKFNVTPNGVIDYDSAYDQFLSGRGTNTLTICGYTVTIDGRSLSHDLIPSIVGAASLSRDRTHELTLVPAAGYRFQPAGGIVADFRFDVDVNGQVVFDPAYGGFAEAKGRTLTLRGYQVTINGTILSHDLIPLLLGNRDVLPRTTNHVLTLLPAAGYRFQPAGGIVADFRFDVDVNGQVVLDPAYGGFAEAKGRTLTLRGHQVTIDGTTLSHDLIPLLLGNRDVLPRTTNHVLTLLPAAGYRFQPAGGIVADFRFGVDVNGQVGIDPPYEGFAEANGRTLTLRGYQVTIDGTALSHDLPLLLLGNRDVLSRTTNHVLTLLPAAGYRFQERSDIPTNFRYTLNLTGQVEFDPQFANFARWENRTLTLGINQIPAPATQYIVRGTVRWSDGTASVGVTVGLDNVKQASTQVGSAITGENGNYEIRFGLPADEPAPDLVVSVFDSNGQRLAVSSTRTNAQLEETIDITIPLEPDPTEETFVVKGYVLQADGSPVPDITMQVFNCSSSRYQQQLGEQSSDRTGFYEIIYQLSQLSRAEKGNVNLVAKAFAADGSLLVASPIWFNAPAIAEINLTIPEELLPLLTLFEKIRQASEPLLDDLTFDQLEENTEHQDITFLVGKTGFSQVDVTRFALAYKLTSRSNLAPEFWFALLGGSFFTFNQTQTLEQQLAIILATLVSLDAIAVRNSLNRSFNRQEIPTALQENIEEWISAFLQFVAYHTVSDTIDEPSFIQSVLNDAGVTTSDKQIQFARLFNQYRDITPALITELEQTNTFSGTEIADIQTSFQLKGLTQGNFSVVKAIKDGFDIHQPDQIRSLAKQGEQNWVEFVTTQSAAENITIPVQISDTPVPVALPQTEIYGKMLDRQFREAFPTTAFVGGLERALQNGGAHGIQRAEALNQFLTRHENFEFLNTPVDSFFQERLDPDLQELAADRNFRLEVKAVQRVFKLASNFEATDTLLADNLHSAQQIYRLGETEFVRRYGDRPGFTPETARLAWNRAADTHAATLSIVADLKAMDNEGQPFALKHGGDLSTFPNWNNLFQAGDLCECEHCRSVLSPAAYFADLLMFLKDRDARPGNGKVKDVLFRRRPDLGFLELNCDNALVPLPYIDTVCEVLEAAIASINESEVLETAIDATNENDLELTGLINLPSIPDDPVAAQAVLQEAKTEVIAAFQAAASGALTEDSINYGKQIIDLSSDVSLSQIDEANPDRWVIHSDTVTYLLSKRPGTPHFFATILRNTKAKAEELRSYPQYVNPKAYEKLRQAKYPMTLPFDLFAAEVRAGFQKTNLQRWDLMRTFQNTSAPTEGDIAAEYFGISSSATPSDPSVPPPPSEKSLILVADSTEDGQQEIWGELDNTDWLNPNPNAEVEAEIERVVGNVKKFLQKTNLDYNELLALLDLKFINPTGDVAIRHFDSSCDTNKKAVLVLDAPTLDRIHRFLRLWRKLDDWKMWELDLVIRHPRIGNGSLDELFLINLFYFSQLKNKLGNRVTVEQVCALFGNLNTETHFTQLHEKREDALYQKLFLNKRLIQPVDPAFFLVPPSTESPDQALSPGQNIIDHHPTILAALGIREADLVLLKSLTKEPGGTPYVINDLNLRNVSILWRHAWLCRLLKFKVEDWKTLLKLLHQRELTFPDLNAAIDFLDNPQGIFDSPKSAFEFLEKVDHLKVSGFTPDELSWLLAGDRTSKASPKETDATRFLSELRQQLQTIKAEYSPTQYGFLTNDPPTDVDSLTALLTSLLQKLNRSEAEVSKVVAVLRGSVLLEAGIKGLPSGFAFPATIVGAPNHISIQYDELNQRLRFTGLMTDAQRQILLDDSSATLVTLRNSIVSETGVQDLPPGFTFPAAIVGTPNNILIQYDESNRRLRFTGAMSAAQRQVLLNDASLADITRISAYQNAIEALYQQSLTVIANYRNAIETLYQQSLSALTDYFSIEKAVALPGDFTFPATITGSPNAIPIRFEQVLRFTGVMTDDQKNILLTHPDLNAVTSIPAYRAAIEQLFTQPGKPAAVTNLPTGFSFPPTITEPPNAIPIRFEQVLRFTGAMTDDQKETLLNDPSLAAVTGNASYQTAIAEFFDTPRRAVKFFEFVFTAPLAKLPVEVDFKTGLQADLAAKISYDPEQELLRFNGIMTDVEKETILALSPDSDYVAAVDQLAEQSQFITSSGDRIWLTDTDLDITQPGNDTYARRLANAITKALTYLSRTSAENVVVQQISTQLGLTEAVSRYLLTQYTVIPNLPSSNTLLTHLASDLAIDATTLNAWFWANRVASIWKKWKLTLTELKKVTALILTPELDPNRAGLLDWGALPLESGGAIASLDHFLRTSRLLQLRDSLPETQITLLEVLEKLNKDTSGTYAASAYAADVERVSEEWSATDVAALVASLNLTYPDSYLLAETWERLRRAFYFLDNLNASADRVKTFAAAAMTGEHAKTLKELLRSKFGTETWLTLSAEIQDVLRERKRDALSTYLLSQPKPDDAPSGKWENTNDLYAYYLLDVEMSSCQLTSRLVQASGSVQLFVQRCFMGLEPEVIVKADGADGDSAWRWWKWMRKYRVWEANRKVFLWPENWIEPELKKDRSPFFKDLENELLQNEINQDTVEKAFINYLEKLDGVAQLEIAGFYQEDDGDNTILHVLGRTPGAEPHLYYYRRYDYRQWTPWEKVDLDIQGNYLIPAVVNQRLYLFWPIFTEVPAEAENSTVRLPTSQDQENGSFTPDRTQKKLRLQMAVSDFRQGKWTPKRISIDFDESRVYEVEIVKQHYRFYPIDRSQIDGRFGIGYDGYSSGRSNTSVEETRLTPVEEAGLRGAFEFTGCSGVLEKVASLGEFNLVLRPESALVSRDPRFLKWVEESPGLRNEFAPVRNDFTLVNDLARIVGQQPAVKVLDQTPGIFKMSPPWHLSYLDQIWLDGIEGLHQLSNYFQEVFDRQLNLLPSDSPESMGTWLPFFYNDDQSRTFFVLPTVAQSDEKQGDLTRYYYPNLKKFARQAIGTIEQYITTWLKAFNFASVSSIQRRQLEEFLYLQFNDTPPLRPVGILALAPEGTHGISEFSPSYTDDQIRNWLGRWFLRFYHYQIGARFLQAFQTRKFHFKNFYHPFVCTFLRLVHHPLQGVPALMSRETQLLENANFNFNQLYQPTEAVVQRGDERFYPQENVDFTSDGAYSLYNWELFFHVPLLIANSLSKNQRFEEARDWYHFIFNPIGLEGTRPGGSSMSKYWITKPFYETTQEKYTQQRIDNLLQLLAGETSPAKEELTNQVRDWRTNSFEPHRIANYRTVAYQKTTVMKYVDNLIAWGDNLFRQDSMESINEATQLYILAAEILGPRPQKIPPQAKPPLESFNELENQFDAFSNALVEVENLVPAMTGSGEGMGSAVPLPMLYFCIPQNEKLLSYWDTVADRLYKIRNCMNIEGVVRQLALFEPPIDPAALVKAVAGGVDISSALADLNAPLPLYRFNVLLQKANEVCNDVKALGSALLSALEKKDAEAMGLLRQSQEIRLLEAVKAVREKQVEEAKENLEGLRKSKIVVETRRDYYQDLISTNLIPGEQLSLNKQELAFDYQNQAQSINIAASVLGYLPNITIGASGFGGSPHVNVQWGTGNIISALQAASGSKSQLSNAASYEASRSLTLAGYDRRLVDWDLQKRLAEKELDQNDKSIASATLRVEIAEKELENHLLQIENAKATNEFMRSKYTNQELYQWQIGQISDVYFQSYKLAYDMAKRAERCFRFELGLQDSNYIQFGYWDSLKKGLLSGEKLQYDLRRLEATYLEQNRREFELTKHISLTLLDPLALIKLKETGRCFINLPEEIFDLDYPGHYFRRIKSVSITLPCVVGSYTTISCTLRLLKNSTRTSTSLLDGYPRNVDDAGLPDDDPRFIENNIPVKAIATSTAQNDSGIFELSFRDERYLPFEGAGVISQWSLELFNDDNSEDFGKALRQFDYNTITDAILHIKYTAREEVGAFKSRAIAHLRQYFSQNGTTPFIRMFNLKQEFSNQWHHFLHPAASNQANRFELELTRNLFPRKDHGKILEINAIWILAKCQTEATYNITVDTNLLEEANTNTISMSLVKSNVYGGLYVRREDTTAASLEIVLTDTTSISWGVTMTGPDGSNLQEQEVKDLILGFEYAWKDL